MVVLLQSGEFALLSVSFDSTSFVKQALLANEKNMHAASDPLRIESFLFIIVT
ncbi:hypothetical protein PISS_a1047 [Pseudoalteromonas issachenkonii]|uniref:Uncharacterized protein n=1 Tax=Pseudoalteromonas issachenkonii TaxID=152297 RepID=A0ABN5C7I7_9GAMM|nr:hypothetical protein PISS_a1047 [Pseudoalteromonas issachenkonii]